jgi:glycosyltransferase involved in cell wall biosynthesis
MPRLITVVMPAYNAAKYLAASIESVQCQTYNNWELVVTNDGSTDTTAEVANNLAINDPRIRVISQENTGQAGARNAGLAEARGEFVAFLDADDLWNCDKLEKQIAVMDTTDADLVFSDGEFFSDDKIGEDDGFNIVPGRTEGAEMFRLLFQRNRIATLSVLVKRRVIEKAGGFDQDRRFQNCEDYDLWLTMAKRGAVFYGMTEKLMKYRRHPQASTAVASQLLKPMLEVIKKHAEEPTLEPLEVRKRIRWLYRDLIAALVREGRLDEARQGMREFSGWDRGYCVTRFQQILLSWFPTNFDFLSRELLYRSEWHFGRVLGSNRA